MSWPAEHHINFLCPYMLFSLCIFVFVLSFWGRVDLKKWPTMNLRWRWSAGGSSLYPDPSTFHCRQQKTFAFNTICKWQKLMHKHQKVCICIRAPEALVNIHGPNYQLWTLKSWFKVPFIPFPYFFPNSTTISSIICTASAFLCYSFIIIFLHSLCLAIFPVDQIF